MKKYLIRWHRFFATFFVDPLRLLANLRAVPSYWRNLIAYKKRNQGTKFRLKDASLFFTTYDKYLPAGSIFTHYFFQDLWAAGKIHENNPGEHVDVGSRLDGFVAHVLPFCKVSYVDIRPLVAEIPNLQFIQGSILELPFENESIKSLSCLHVIEHIGLGRYGDAVDPDGYKKAARELTRVLAKEGVLLIGTPTGKEKLFFDAHRVFDPATIKDIFGELELCEFHLIDDSAKGIHYNASFEMASQCNYGCGLYVFKRN